MRSARAVFHRERLAPGLPRLALAALISAVAGRAFAVDPLRTHWVSERSFQDTIQHLEWGFGGYGITVVARLDYQSLVDKEKGSPRNSGMFLIMRQSWGKTIFEKDAAAVLDMPLRVHVYEGEDGKTVVSYYQPSSLFKVYGNDGLTAMGMEIDAVLENIARVATKESGLRERSAVETVRAN
jgi:uncharacterized protein (DUF302 family)